MNEHDIEQGLARREVQVSAWGDTAEELEMNALDVARTFLGPDVRLQVVRGYSACHYTAPSLMVGGKHFHAEVTVRCLSDG